MPSVTPLDARISRLSPQVDGHIRSQLQNLLKTLRLVQDPIPVLLPLSRLCLLLVEKVFADAGEPAPSSRNLYEWLWRISTGDPGDRKSAGLKLMPRFIVTNLDTIRRWTNPLDHADEEEPPPDLNDAEIAFGLYLKALEWYYCEFDRGPRLSSIYGDVGDSPSAPEASAGERRALVVGINVYEDESIPALRFASDDAKAVADFLVERGRFPSDNVSLLTDAEATQRNIKMALSDLTKAEPEDLVVIYFACHGCADVHAANGGRDDELTWKYLVPCDGQRTHLRDTGISMDDLGERFSELKTRNLVVLLDSCYSGAGERSVGLHGARGIYSDVLLEEMSGDGRVILTASQANELAFEGDEYGHGLFTHHALAGLLGAADVEGRGVVTVRQLYNYLATVVPKAAEKIGGRQHPMLKGDLNVDIPLAFLPDDGDEQQPKQIDDQIAATPLSDSLVLHQQGSYDEAVKTLTLYLPQAGNFKGEALRQLGLNHLARHDNEAALKAYEAAIDEEPANAEGHSSPWQKPVIFLGR